MILVIGSINMDVVLRVDDIPAPGETVMSRSMEKNPGGKGANQAAAAAKLGGNVVMLGCVGNDGAGDALIESLRSSGVNTEHILRRECSSSAAYICVSEKGENSIVVDSSANNLVTPEYVRENESLFEQADYCVMQMEIPSETVEAAVQLCRKHHVRTVLNPSPSGDIDLNRFCGIDYLVPNEHEFEALTGKPFEQTGKPEREQFMEKYGIGHLILTLGSEGCVTAEPGHPARHWPTVRRRPVDTTGAGDTFLGAFVVRISEGADTGTAVQFANTASGLQIMRPGAQKAMPGRKEVENELQKDSD